MALGDVIARLAVNLTMETAAFEEGANIAEKRLAKSAKSIEALGQKMTSIGTKLSVGFTLPVVAAGKAAVDGFIEQGKAMADVTAALTSMGGASGRTADQLGKAADAMEMRSLFDAEVILKQVTANLLTFGNVAGQQFDRAQQAAIDMATRLGGEPQAAAIMLGKALNDPTKGITALTRVGVQFTAQQKDQIKAMAAAGNTAGAQGVILAEVERQFRGAAAAAADASPWRQAQVAIGQAMDVIGGAVLPVIKPIADTIATLVSGFAALPAPVQQGVVAAVALGAALGPVLVAVGGIVSAGSTVFAALGSIGASMASVGTIAGGAQVGIAALGGALTALGPIVAIVAAVAAAGYAIYQNWDKIAPVLDELWSTASETLGPPLRELVATLSSAFSELWNGPLGEGIRMAAGALLDLQLAIMKAMGPIVIGAIKLLVEAVGNVAHVIGDTVHLVSSLLKGEWAEAFRAGFDIVNRLYGGLPAKVIGWMQQMVTGIRTWVVDKLDGIWNSVTGKIDTVKRAFFGLYDAVVGHSYVPDMVDGIAAEMDRLDRVMVDPATKAADTVEERYRDLASRVSGLMTELFPEVAKAGENRAKFDLIDEGASSAMILQGTAQEARNRLLQPGIDAANASLGELMARQLPALNKAANDNAGGVEAANVRIVKSFADMAQASLTAVQNFASAIKGGGFLDIVSGIVNLGLQLGSAGVFGKKIATAFNKVSVPNAYASGTRSAAAGLALVGEEGPELVKFRGGERVYNNADTRAMAGGRAIMLNVNPSPYFHVTVDGRAAAVAAPMASRAAVAGSNGAQVALARKQSRVIP